jgi:hypothetical protein
MYTKTQPDNSDSTPYINYPISATTNESTTKWHDPQHNTKGPYKEFSLIHKTPNNVTIQHPHMTQSTILTDKHNTSSQIKQKTKQSASIFNMIVALAKILVGLPT